MKQVKSTSRPTGPDDHNTRIRMKIIIDIRMILKDLPEEPPSTLRPKNMQDQAPTTAAMQAAQMKEMIAIGGSNPSNQPITLFEK